MGFPLRPRHLPRYLSLARLLLRHRGAARPIGWDDLAPPDRAVDAADAEALARDLERLGPTFVKLGQLLSTRPDLLPPAYTAALARLQDRVTPLPVADVLGVVEADLGVRVHQVFPEFDPTPLASASLGQVHAATLRDGRRVAVKVQRPEVRARVADDLAVLQELAAFLDQHTAGARRYHLLDLVEEFRRTLAAELDYRQEAHHLHQLRHQLAEFPALFVPAPIDGLVAPRVLTMEFVRGVKITQLPPVRRTELDTAALADALFAAYLKQVLVDGFFHADPHPGNVFVTDDDRLALLDVGMVGHLAPERQDQLLAFLLALADGHADEAAHTAEEIGTPEEDFDRLAFRHRATAFVLQTRAAPPERLQVGGAVLAFTRLAAEAGLRLPPEFATLGRTLLALDQVGRTLDPSFDPNAAIRRHAADLLQRRLRQRLAPGAWGRAAMDSAALAQELPGAVRRVLRTWAANDVRLRVDAFDEARLLTGLRAIANRITLGLLLAALVLGGALLLHAAALGRGGSVASLALLLFVLAAGGALGLALHILLHDERAPRRRR